ncbi:MAG: protein kinase [Thermoflexales bacterium]|nr:protein kinase [Thermoflexales bacterium]
MDLTPAQLLNNRYRILKLLGTGGMGAVYHAHDTVLNRDVALKQLQPDPVTGDRPEQIQQQFLREAQSLAALHHPNLPRVTDHFTADNQQYLVMDYIAGQSLQDVLQAAPQGLDETQVLAWADQLLSALEYIHQHQLIHRDIKPANIRLTPAGHIFLVDFGLVKQHDTANPRTISLIRGIGTPEYAPPEQYDASSAHTDERSDIYALGATLYHLLAGCAPTSVSVRMSDPERFRPLRAINANLSPVVEQVILRAMEIERAKRFASATDMRRALQLANRSSADQNDRTTQLPALDRPTRPAGRSVPRAVVIAASLSVLVGLVIIVLATRSSSPAPTPTTAPTRAEIKITRLDGTGGPEVLVLENSGGTAQDLSGWYVESTIGPQTFNFPAGYKLAAGGVLHIESYTGAKNDPPSTLLWSTDPIWRNAGDKAILRNTAGAAISTQCYGDACP